MDERCMDTYSTKSSPNYLYSARKRNDFLVDLADLQAWEIDPDASLKQLMPSNLCISR